jgi:hypothetical protein
MVAPTWPHDGQTAWAFGRLVGQMEGAPLAGLVLIAKMQSELIFCVPYREGRQRTMGKIRILTSAGLLLVSVQTCFAAGERQETFKLWWSFFGQQAEQEIAVLPRAGRLALQKALVACSLFVDDYLNAQYQTECERTSKFFVVEFTGDGSSVGLLLKNAVVLSSAQQTLALLDAQQGRRGNDDPQTRKVFIEVLQKAYHDANFSPSDLFGPPRTQVRAP